MIHNSSSLDALYADPWVKAELDYTRRIIGELLADEARNSPILEPALKNLQKASGKMLRPLLVILGARGGGGIDYPQTKPAFDGPKIARDNRKFLLKLRQSGWSPETNESLTHWKNSPALPGFLPNRIYLLAAALELLHLATLVHDDVVDESPMRRGQAAMWKDLGTNLAVLLGDLLFSLCFALVSHGADVSTGQMLSGMVRLMVRSEFFQAEDRLQFESLLKKPSRRRYTRIITGKTAMLFSLSLNSGAREMNAPEPILQMYRRGGYYLGLAFQIQDDILDYLGAKQRFGKPLGQDLRDSQITLPILEALGAATQTQADRGRKLVEAIEKFRKGDEGEFPQIVLLIQALGGFDRADQQSREYLERAQREFHQACKATSTPGVYARLNQLLMFLENRRY